MSYKKEKSKNYKMLKKKEKEKNIHLFDKSW